jgi:hypothetical protein
MADTSTFSQAVKGGNNPTQNTSTLTGFYDAPNPLFRVMNQNTVTDIQALSDGKVGTFLQRRKLVNGDVATIINASLDYFLGDKVKNLPPISNEVKHSNAKKTFIPIIIKTEFTFDLSTPKFWDSRTGPRPVTRVPLYIIFDSTPENISFTKSANWVPKNFLGRPEPIYTYNDSSSTTFSLTGKFFVESFEAHGRLLKMSDYIMSLVTPSLVNYMPSPVTVFIGEWKQLRCIVNNVTIKYEGPWVVKLGNTDFELAKTQEEADFLSSNQVTRNMNGKVPSHAPYMFEATFSFTQVGRDNEVKYAEQVVANGSSNSSDVLNSDDPALRAALEAVGGGSRAVVQVRDLGEDIQGLYNLQVNNTYTYNASKIVQNIDTNLSYTTSAETMNLYDSANAQRRLGDQGMISNAISGQLVKMVQKNNPNLSNAQTTSSLNPFKKLF